METTSSCSLSAEERKLAYFKNLFVTFLADPKALTKREVKEMMSYPLIRQLIETYRSHKEQNFCFAFPAQSILNPQEPPEHLLIFKEEQTVEEENSDSTDDS